MDTLSLSKPIGDFKKISNRLFWIIFLDKNLKTKDGAIKF
ncbi:hypothetical protein FUSO6_07330 [Fusobacterium necrophorum DAB]|nr:hypothetical protein FUSO6_07330 [Fusobacterium necrophorum DAB]